MAIGLVFGARIEEGVLGALLMIVFVTLAAIAFGASARRSRCGPGSASVVQGLFPLVFVILFLSSGLLPLHADARARGDDRRVQPGCFIVEGVRDPVISTLTGDDAWKAFASITGIAASSLGLSSLALRH